MGERKFIFLGCHFDGELVAAGVFGSTITDPVKKLWTSQLFFFKELKRNSSPSQLDSLLSFYIEKYHPADIFVESTVAEKDCLQYSLLLTQEENSENFFWRNTELTFYTYKITSLKSKKYYYGVSHVKKANATLEDCLNDGYFGSGGKDSKNKFFNWKKKYADSVEKEVLELHVNKAEAYSYESELISDKWLTDKNCLNSRAGGFVVPNHRISYILKECAVHGATLHAGESCKKCVARKGLQLKRCETHGEAIHQGKHCKKCIANKRNSFKTCGIHGRTLHQGNSCLKCSIRKGLVVKECSIHGFIYFRGEFCTACLTSELFELGKCERHGEVKFRNGKCTHCSVKANISEKECVVHGLTIHQGDTCAKCSMPEVTTKICDVHGEASFTGNVCNTCRSYNGVSKKLCKIHGEVTFIGEQCRVCVNLKSVTLRECPIHGLVKHQGIKCSTCNSQRVAHKRHINGKVGKTCFLCLSNSL